MRSCTRYRFSFCYTKMGNKSLILIGIDFINLYFLHSIIKNFLKIYQILLFLFLFLQNFLELKLNQLYLNSENKMLTL